jgi:di/tripeptidase
MSVRDPFQSDAEIAVRARRHLESVVAIESASDEDSPSIPSTEGQAELARFVGAFFSELGAEIEQDDFANVIASFPGRGEGEHAEPLALMVHLDTARGTEPRKALALAEHWSGEALVWSDNPRIRVDVETYPALAAFVGQDVLYGSGAAPFGLDDKLGLTHMMTLAWLLATNSEISHPPLLLIGRPDEEIGRMEALVGLAALLAERGVRTGYTVDGIEAFEVNVENFNAAGASILFPKKKPATEGTAHAIRLIGVNTHGATAHAEGHRSATRLAAEVLQSLLAEGVEVIGFRSDPARECDAMVVFAVPPDQVGRLGQACEEAVAAHRSKGAGWATEPVPAGFEPDAAAGDMLRFVSRFLASDPGHTLLAEDSWGRDGYSHPYRSFPVEHGVQLDIRVRDFSPEGLAERLQHIQALAGAAATVVHQYVNMGPRLEDRPELVTWAQEAAATLQREAQVLPIRGGTGIDPFLDAGVAVGNLGTGYFAPESEKELTSLQMLVGHARWLLALVQIVARA